MAPRAAVRALLGTDSELQSYGFTVARIFASGAVDTPDRESRWMVVKFMERTARFALVGAWAMEVWLYQPYEFGKDYGVLDVAAVRIRELMTTAEQLAGADGWTLNGAEWESDSPDLSDDAFQALMKFSRFRVSARQMVTL